MPAMSDTTAEDLVIPETVTISASAAIETLALLEAYEEFASQLSTRSQQTVLADLEGLSESEAEGGPFELRTAIRGGRDDDQAFDASYDATDHRKRELVERINKLVGPVRGR